MEDSKLSLELQIAKACASAAYADVVVVVSGKQGHRDAIREFMHTPHLAYREQQSRFTFDNAATVEFVVHSDDTLLRLLGRRCTHVVVAHNVHLETGRVGQYLSRCHPNMRCAVSGLIHVRS